jgi:hypothetical protein
MTVLESLYRLSAIAKELITHRSGPKKDEQELRNMVTGWLKDALGPGADFSGKKIEAIADDEFYFSRIKDNKGRECKFRVFRRFDEN